MSEKEKTADAAKAEAQQAQDGEKVLIRLFKDNNRYTAPVFVGINGETWLIQRGVDVEVPKAVAEVLERSAAQDEEAARRAEALAASSAKTIMM